MSDHSEWPIGAPMQSLGPVQKVFWTGVELMLPDEDIKVLVWAPHSDEGVIAAVYATGNDGETCWWDLETSNVIHGVTHWADYPNPPKLED